MWPVATPQSAARPVHANAHASSAPGHARGCFAEKHEPMEGTRRASAGCGHVGSDPAAESLADLQTAVTLVLPKKVSLSSKNKTEKNIKDAHKQYLVCHGISYTSAPPLPTQVNIISWHKFPQNPR